LSIACCATTLSHSSPSSSDPGTSPPPPALAAEIRGAREAMEPSRVAIREVMWVSDGPAGAWECRSSCISVERVSAHHAAPYNLAEEMGQRTKDVIEKPANLRAQIKATGSGWDERLARLGSQQRPGRPYRGGG
jgi:hypothetical protein